MVILAAGASTRMGEPKLLLEWQGRTLVRHAAEVAIGSGAQPIVLVTGSQDAEMRSEVRGLPVQVVNNSRSAEGMSTSLRAGISHLPDNTHGAIVMLSDQPMVTSEIVERLAQELRSSSATIVQPRYAGTPGNPVGFHRSLFAELCRQHGDQGAREILRSRRGDIQYVDFDDSAVQRDIDTPEDYAALAAQQEAGR